MTILTTILTLRRSGSQKIAEARMHWNELHRKLSVELNAVFSRMAGSGNARRLIKDREAAVALVTEILLMINPGDKDESARAELALQNELLKRIQDLGLQIDLKFVELHRSVLKNAWRTAKTEF